MDLTFVGEPPTRVEGVAVNRVPEGRRLKDLPHDQLTPSCCPQLSASDVLGGGARMLWTWDGRGPRP